MMQLFNEDYGMAKINLSKIISFLRKFYDFKLKDLFAYKTTGIYLWSIY